MDSATIEPGIQLRRAKKYSSIKYALVIIETAYLFVLLLVFLNFGFSKALKSEVFGVTANDYLAVALYLFIISAVYYILNLPFNFYHSFLLERKFSLSNQKIKDWLFDQVKSAILSYLVIFTLLCAFYYILKIFPNYWWLAISIFWVFFSLILAKLTPIIIIPLFFKYKKLSDQILRERIIKLADKMQIKILDVFEIDFSKKTLKANAAFVGVGLTKRVVLADTLKDKYSHDEIEVILAHEFSHYKLRHLLKLIALNSFAIILTFYFIYISHMFTLSLFSFSALSDIAALPVIFIYFLLFGIIMQPFENYVSRRLEANADRLALNSTGLKDAFISMMEKLAAQNLADRSPHPLIKFFFFDHPPTEERIAQARSFSQ